MNNVANDLLVFGIGEGGTVSQQSQNGESLLMSQQEIIEL